MKFKKKTSDWFELFVMPIVFFIPVIIVFYIAYFSFFGSKSANDHYAEEFYEKYQKKESNDYSYNDKLLTHKLISIDRKYGVSNQSSFNKAISNVNAFLSSASKECVLTDKEDSIKHYVSCVNNVLGNNFYYTQSVDVSNNYAIHRSDCDTNTYLMMDALRNKGIKSFMVYAPGHAFLAYRNNRGELSYQETTYNNNHGQLVNFNDNFYRKTFDRSYYTPFNDDIAINVYQALISDEAKNKVDLKALFERNKDNAFLSDWYFTYKDSTNSVNENDINFISDKLKLDITSNDKRIAIVRYLMKKGEMKKAKDLYESIDKRQCDKLCFITGSQLGYKANKLMEKIFLKYDAYMKENALGGIQRSFYNGVTFLIIGVIIFIIYVYFIVRFVKCFFNKVSFMQSTSGDVQYYLHKNGELFSFVKKIKTLSRNLAKGKKKSTMLTIVDIKFKKEDLEKIDFNENNLREKDKDIISDMIDELESNFSK